MTNHRNHPLWQLVDLTRRTLDASPQLTRRQALRAAVNYLDRAERNLDGDLADRATECCAAELAAQGSTITCGCDACEARDELTLVRIGSSAEAHSRPFGAIEVEDNHGHRYTARALKPGDAYGNGGTWGSVFYQEGRLGVTIDGLPSTYFADSIARLGDRPFPGPLAIDSGQGWLLTEESTAAFVRLARDAMATAGARGLS